MTNVRTRLKQLSTIITLGVFLFTVMGGQVRALTEEQVRTIKTGVRYFNVAPDNNCDTASSQSTNAGDMTDVAQHYSLHSAVVKQIGGSVIKSYNPDQQPVATASVLKLIIADVFLSTHPDFSRSVIVTADENYFGSGGGDGSLGSPKTGQSIKLSDVLLQMLKFSSDTDANVLIDAAGGLEQVNALAGTLGYSNTSILSYYNDQGNATIAPNKSTVSDLTKAMEKIATSTDPVYQLAYAYLTQETVKYGLSSDANKWGGTSKVTGNSAVFTVGQQRYIITLYVEKDWKGDKDASDPTSGASDIKNATNDILASLQNNTSAGSTNSASSAQCCGASTVSGADNEAQVWNFLVGQMGLSAIQAAGIMGNMKAESGFDPTAYNPGTHTDNPDPSRAFGIAQWTQGRQIALRQAADDAGKPITDMGVQLNFLKTELESSYKSSTLDPIKASNDLQEVTRIWLVHFEVPCTESQTACINTEMSTRLPNAQDILTRLGSGASTTSSASSGCGNFNFGKYASMSRDELVSLILNAPNWKPQSDNPVKDINSGVAVDNLLRLVAALLEALPNELITPSVIQTGHDCHTTNGNISNHMGGLAIDIGGAGHSVESMNTIFTWLYNNAAALGVNELIFDPVPSGTSTLSHGKPFEYDAATRQEHQNHIHVSVEGPRPTACPAGTT